MRRGEKLVAALLAVTLAVGLRSVVLVRPSSPAGSTGSQTRGEVARTASSSRTAAITALLARRATAVLTHNRALYLADLDPTQAAFRDRQAASFDDLRALAFTSWRYTLDPKRQEAHTDRLNAERGRWWAPQVSLRYSLSGYDVTPTQEQQGLTFTERSGRWYLASDDDFPDHPTQAELWDGGPVEVLRGSSCAVLAHPAELVLAVRIRRDCDLAVPAVTAVWGRDWARRVVLLVPSSSRELKRLVPDAGDISNIEAVATAELIDPATGYHPVGNRVVVNPDTFAQLRAIGSRIVLTHEVTHVASRSVTGPSEPTWLVEGLADYVGFLHAGLALSVSAEELQVAIRAGHLPRELPADSDYQGGRSDLAATYEAGWLAVTLIVKTYGQAALLKLYRDVGTSTATDPLAIGFAEDLHTNVPAFTAAWRASLHHQLG